MIVKISNIIVKPRIRKTIGDLSELAASIKHHGLWHPIVIDLDFVLRAGERRLEAHKLLGREEIECKQLGELAEDEKLEIELEENLQRVDLSWSEVAIARKTLHELKQRLYGKDGLTHKDGHISGHSGWSIRDTQKALNEKGFGLLHADLELGTALELFPSLAEEKTKAAALRRLRIIQFSTSLDVDLPGETARWRVEQKDALEFVKSLPDSSIHLCIIDPPWGVALDESASYRGYEVFDDSLVNAQSVLAKLVPELFRVLKADAHLYCFFGMNNYQLFLTALSELFEVSRVPLIWDKAGVGGLASTSVNVVFVPSYETVFFCRKGNRPLMEAKPSSVFQVAVVSAQQKHHPTEKPVALLKRFIELSSAEGDTVLDCFVGSGSCAVAAVESDRRFIGCDIDSMYVALTKTRLMKGAVDAARQDIPTNLGSN